MRKKFFAMYALVGALVASPVFTSCVDDSESASVTAIRNAKAEQLKAAAAYDLALTEYQKAQTALKEAELAAKLADNEQDKALFEYQLATAKAEYEKTALEYEKTKLEYLKSMANTENEMISNAASKYTNALDELNLLNVTLLEAKKSLAQVGIDSTENVALLNELVAQQNATIIEKTTEIERLKAYKGESEESLKTKMDAVVANYKSLNSEKAVADDAKAKTATALSDAGTAYGDVEYVEVIDKLTSTPYNMTINTENFDTETGLNAYIESYSALLESEILTNKQTLKQTLATEKTNLGAPKTDAAPATGLYTQLETLETALKTAQDALAANTDATLTAGLETAVEDAQIDVAEFKEQTLQPQLDAVKAAEDAIAEFDALIAAFAEGSDEYKEWAAAQEALVAAKKADEEAQDKVDELDDAIAATGIISWSETSMSWSGGEYGVLANLKNYSQADATKKIAELEADIAEAKAKIEKGIASQYIVYEDQDCRYWDSNRSTWVYYTATVLVTKDIYGITTEELKALYQAEIDAIEAKIEVKETLVAKYKAELDALLTAEA